MTPDFARWILQTPEEDRHGTVFQVPGLLDGTPLTPRRVSRIVSKIGEKAGVVVSRETRWVSEPIRDPKTGKPTGDTKLVEREVVKYASVHDLRRAFCSRWASKVMPAVLQKLARHRSVTTTLKYYVSLESDEVAASLWKGAQGTESKVLGTTLGTISENAAKKDAEGSDAQSSEPSCAASSYESGGQGTRTLNRQAGT